MIDNHKSLLRVIIIFKKSMSLFDTQLLAHLVNHLENIQIYKLIVLILNSNKYKLNMD